MIPQEAQKLTPENIVYVTSPQFLKTTNRGIAREKIAKYQLASRAHVEIEFEKDDDGFISFDERLSIDIHNDIKNSFARLDEIVRYYCHHDESTLLNHERDLIRSQKYQFVKGAREYFAIERTNNSATASQNDKI